LRNGERAFLAQGDESAVASDLEDCNAGLVDGGDGGVLGIRGGALKSVVAEFKIAAWRAMLGRGSWPMFNDKWLASAIARGAMIRAKPDAVSIFRPATASASS
jgi:hypothetical protein